MSESVCSVAVRWFSAAVSALASPVYATLMIEISTEMTSENVVTPYCAKNGPGLRSIDTLSAYVATYTPSTSATTTAIASHEMTTRRVLCARGK